ncbi:hypothetical protein IEO21_01893 [Rhodonia placenta]|uniref:Enoyl reductase (ER) domain-containing protein n=1 Tax=Rhodonia placenta TaxID=104341 RepID=A0A8H7U537_9APHY|nr:hypothetical protein IEO21_01893 [Postia placenta]
MDSQLPKSTKVLILQKSSPECKPIYHDVILEERPIPALKEGQILVKVNAAGLNHREIWQRKGQYPDTTFGSVMGADGAGTVVASTQPNDNILGKRVFLNPTRGWDSHPDAPESRFSIIGGGSVIPIGTLTQYVVVEREHVIPTPEHLDDEHAAAWPVGGVTAWRAAVVNARVQKGDNVLITGVGGGVAVLAMQICLAHGANVYVTSGSEEKIAKAIALGAKAGVNYKTEGWHIQLEQVLKKSSPKNPLLSAIIDSAGGDITTRANKMLKQGGRIVVYGMTASPLVPFTMREVLKNQQLIGSTMGSCSDLRAATQFIADHSIVPLVSHIVDGLEKAEDAFELLHRGEQFGKIVISIDGKPMRRSVL